LFCADTDIGEKCHIDGRLLVHLYSTVVGISPGKRINLCTECIQQLQQLGELLDKGNITSDQYEKLQETILSDIYKI